MLYAKIVLGLPVEGPFDYTVPDGLSAALKPGCRVWVNFRNKKEVGFVVGLASQSSIPRLKPILQAIDTVPVLDTQALELTGKIAAYYCCSWGEAIAASLPEPLRKGKTVLIPASVAPVGQTRPEIILLEDPGAQPRWDYYARQIRQAHAEGRSSILLVSDRQTAAKALRLIKEKTGFASEATYRKEPHELAEWARIKSEAASIVIGTRSSVFAPVNNLGLIIVDEEQDAAFKQDQAPHYHASRVSLMRATQEKARLIYCGSAFSLERFFLYRTGLARLESLARTRALPEIKVIDMKGLPLLDKKRKVILSRLIQDTMVSTLGAQGTVLIFLNRKGFATTAACSTCGKAIKCPRCTVNLVYHFDANILRCHYCNYTLVPPKLCPECNSGYIKYSGAGTEKIESELARIFPQARIQRWEAEKPVSPGGADIVIASQSIIKHSTLRFGLTVVIGIDNTLNHVDFRSSERAFAVLSGLAGMTDTTMFVQTSVPAHYCFEAFRKQEPGLFYDEELRLRKQVGFPPFRNFCEVKLRGKKEEAVAAAAGKLHAVLLEAKKPRGVKVISVKPGIPAKLRGNFYWSILLSTVDVPKLSAWLKINVRNFRSSGIIVTVDVDPQ